MRRALGLAAILALVAGQASAGIFFGPARSFTLDYDGDWSAIEAQDRAGLVCGEAACGEDHVACLVLPRVDEGAAPGKALPDMLIDRFGDKLISMPPAGMRSAYAAAFAPRTIGPVSGSWAEIRSTGETSALHFGLFLFAAPGFDIAFSCGAPDVRWDAHKGRIEKLLAGVTVSATSEAPPPPGPHVPDAAPR